MALWDRKIYWQFGGNVQPVRMICEVDWKSCPFSILNYVWSEIVTDVIDYVTVPEGVLWRVIILVFCTLLILYTFWSKITELIENIMKEEIFNGINFKLQNLEMRVNVLAYRMQYGTWPLPPDKNSEVIKTEDNQLIELFPPSSPNSWYRKFIPECILKRTNNLKLNVNEPSTLDEPLGGVYDKNCVRQKGHCKRRACKKCVKGTEPSRHSIKCQTSQEIRKSTGIQCQGSDESPKGEWCTEIPLKLLNNSRDTAKLVTSTKITLGKVRQRLESLHTVLKIYRNEQGINLTRERTAQEVNLLDTFLQELSDLHSATESDERRLKNIPKNIELLETEVYKKSNDNALLQNEISIASLAVNPANEAECIFDKITANKADNFHELNFQETIPSSDSEIIMGSLDSHAASSKNAYASQALDSIIEEHSGNSSNEQNTDCEDHGNQRAKSNAPDPEAPVEVSEDNTQGSHPSRKPVISSTEESQGFQDLSNRTHQKETEELEDLENKILPEINKEPTFGGPNNEVDKIKINSNEMASEIIVCSRPRSRENLSNSMIDNNSAFIKLENIKFTALTEIENSWTNELFVDEHLKCLEPMVLKNSFTGINFTINVLSDDFRERIARLEDIIDPNAMQNSPNSGHENNEERNLQLMTLPQIPHENNLSLNVPNTSTESSIEKPKGQGIPFKEARKIDLGCTKRKNNSSKSSIDVSSRRSKSYGTPRTCATPSKPSTTPRISPESSNQKYKIKGYQRSASLGCIRRENCLKSKSKSGIPVLKSRLNDVSTRRSRDHCNPLRTPLALPKKSQNSSERTSNGKFTGSNQEVANRDQNSEEQTIIYINIINELHNNPMKMENSQEFSDYVRENIFKVRGLTEYIKNSGVSKIVTIVCSAGSENSEDQFKNIEIIPQRKFVIDTNTL